jgi:outer membrane protein OmpA-like peptidoglycan-associated protein
VTPGARGTQASPETPAAPAERGERGGQRPAQASPAQPGTTPHHGTAERPAGASPSPNAAAPAGAGQHGQMPAAPGRTTGAGEQPNAPPRGAQRSPAVLQLEAQGKTGDARRVEELNRKLQADQDKLRGAGPRQPPLQPPGAQVQRFGDRVVIRQNNTVFVRPDRESENARLLYQARDVNVRHVNGSNVETTVIRDDGSRIVTVRDGYGNIVSRTRIGPSGTRYVLIDDHGRQGPNVYRPVDLPPLRIDPRRRGYIVELDDASEMDVHNVLIAPPVERLDRAYTLQQVRTSISLRNRMPRIDLDITFPTGSAAIPPDQVTRLARLGNALAGILRRNPDEVFLIEGFTDAVGSDDANLVLSDQRAEAVAVALSDSFGIPPENLVTQGYGEQFLKVDTQEAERANRRVSVQRITPLIRNASAR